MIGLDGSKWDNRLSIVTAVALFLASAQAGSDTLSPEFVRVRTIAWLEAHQEADGSWGSGITRPLVTAESLVALASAGRCQTLAAGRAADWLANQHYVGIDFRARAVRALSHCALPSSELGSELEALSVNPGWGPVSGAGITSYDTALAIGGLLALGRNPESLEAPLGEVFTRQLSSGVESEWGGWAGDFLPVSGATTALEPTTSSEIVRARFSRICPPRSSRMREPARSQ